MQFETFKVFSDLAETESFSQAAELNEVTQSAVSQQIRALERRFEVVLIERGKKTFALTPEGCLFLETCREMLELFSNFEEHIKEMQHTIAGELRIATIHSIGLHELPPYIKKFRQNFPQVDLKVSYMRNNQVYLEVLEGKVDCGFVSYPKKRKGLVVESIWRDKMVLICSPNHRLAKKKKVALDQLRDENFISFDPDLPTRKSIDRMLKAEGVRVVRTMEFDNIETVKRAVEIENGVSIVPLKTVAEELRAGTLAAVEVDTEGEEIWRPLGLVQRRAKSVSPAHRQLIELLREQEEL